MRKIDIDELHSIVLDIAKEFHRVCVKNNIPYYMGWGTMLGAVRHKGFIPWDDDMDFCIMREYWEPFIKACERDLQHPYKIVTKYNSEYPINYVKIQNVNTLMDDPDMRFKKNIGGQIGIWIDIFPIDHCSSNIDEIRPLLKKRLQIDHIITGAFYSLSGDFKHRLGSKILRLLICQSRKNRLKWLDKKEQLIPLIQSTGDDACGCFYAIYKEKDIFNKEFFAEPVLYPFEDTELYGVSKPHEYLKHIYNDYMQLPPEDKRHIHAENFYVK